MAEKAAITQQFLVRKMAEVEALRAEIAELRGEINDGDACPAKALIVCVIGRLQNALTFVTMSYDQT
ncbi:hypothetical protein TP2_17325 [Thioclava pacifica DSM 10166]|uniref:Uncharacterized protein n=1 Tax=Thioclava pacifica DSM 10166 TaxID=1353537 RepID=A0A074JAQ2_9RHOB|nr:hypothetical protein TP2_17325 [Thioclava pacifica DSM 10166]